MKATNLITASLITLGGFLTIESIAPVAGLIVLFLALIVNIVSLRNKALERKKTKSELKNLELERQMLDDKLKNSRNEKY